MEEQFCEMRPTQAHIDIHTHTRLLPEARHDLKSLYIPEMCCQSPVSLRICFGKTTAWETMVRSLCCVASKREPTHRHTLADRKRCQPQMIYSVVCSRTLGGPGNRRHSEKGLGFEWRVREGRQKRMRLIHVC